jgi:heterodisulfide reductase subunit A-like polyferredoxin
MLPLASIAIALGAILPLVSANGLPEIIYRDVAIIGGGASGAYAAVRLRDDSNKSIVLIEKQRILVSLKILVSEARSYTINSERCSEQ